MISGGEKTAGPGPRHGLRRRDDHLQRHPRHVPAGRRASAAASRSSTPRAPAAPWPRWPRIATLSLVLPSFTTSRPGPQFSPAQLAFAAVASLALYLLFVLVQTRRHRDYFLPDHHGRPGHRREDHADPPSARAALRQPRPAADRPDRGRRPGQGRLAVDRDRRWSARACRRPWSAWSSPCWSCCRRRIAAVRAAARDRIQTSLNLALGSAMASIGLTIPAIAIAIDLAGRAAAARPRRHADGAARADRGGRHADGGAGRARTSCRAASTWACWPSSCSWPPALSLSRIKIILSRVRRGHDRRSRRGPGAGIHSPGGS